MKALAIVILVAMIIAPALHQPTAVEPQKQVLIVISEPLNSLYDKGFRDFIYRLNNTIYERFNYSTNFRLASSVQITPDIAANYSMVIVLFPQVSSRYENETTLNSILTFQELYNRSILVIGNTSDMNYFLRRYGREIGDAKTNVTVHTTFEEPILNDNYTYPLNYTRTIVESDANETQMPPYLYTKDYSTYPIMSVSENEHIAVAAETFDMGRFVAFTAVEALVDGSKAPRANMFKDILDRLMGDSYKVIPKTIVSYNITVPGEPIEGDVAKARLKLNDSLPANAEVYIELYRGSDLSSKVAMNAINGTYYEGSLELPVGISDLYIVVYVKGYGFRHSDPLEVTVNPNRTKAPMDYVLTALFILSRIATLVGLLLVRKELRG